MPRPKPAIPRTAADYTEAYRARQVEEGARRLSLFLSPSAARALDKLAPERGQVTPLIERLLIKAADP